MTIIIHAVLGMSCVALAASHVARRLSLTALLVLALFHVTTNVTCFPATTQSTTPSATLTPSQSGSASATSSNERSVTRSQSPASTSRSGSVTWTSSDSSSRSHTATESPTHSRTSTNSFSRSGSASHSVTASATFTQPTLSTSLSVGTATSSLSHSGTSATRRSATLRSVTLSFSKHVSRSSRTPTVSLSAASLSHSWIGYGAANATHASVSLTVTASGTASGTANGTVTAAHTKESSSPSSTLSSLRSSVTNSVSLSAVKRSATSSLTAAVTVTFSLTVTRTPPPTPSPTRSSSASRSQSKDRTRTFTLNATMSATCPHCTVSTTFATSRSVSSSIPTPSRTSVPTNSSMVSVSSTQTITWDLPPPFSPCPLPSASVFPPQPILDTDIQARGLVVWLNLSSSSRSPAPSTAGQFRWVVSAPRYVVLQPQFAGSQPERQGSLYTLNVSCSIVGDKMHLRCVVPPTPAYTLEVRETIDVVVLNTAFEAVECTPSRLVAVSILVETVEQKRITAARVLSFAIGVEGFFASWFGAQSMVYDGHLIAMVGHMSCASTLDRFMTSRIMYLVAPMQDYGMVATAYFNMFLFAVFFTVHLAVTMLHSQRVNCPFNDAAEITTFPGLSYCCAVALHAGICYGTMQLALNSSSSANASSSAAGFLYIIAVFVVLFYSLRRFAKVSFVEYGFVRSMSPLQQWFLPSGYWDPKQPRRMFGRMLVTVGAGRLLNVPYQMVVITCFAVVTSVRPTTFAGCRALFFVMAGFLFLSASQVAWWRPHRIPIQNATTTLTLSMLGVQCCLQAVSSYDHTTDLDDPKSAMWLLQMLVIALRGAFDIVIVLWENFRWGAARIPKYGVLDEDHFASENHTVGIEGYEFQEDLAAYGARGDEEMMPSERGRQDAAAAVAVMRARRASIVASSLRGSGSSPANSSYRHTSSDGLQLPAFSSGLSPVNAQQQRSTFDDGGVDGSVSPLAALPSLRHFAQDAQSDGDDDDASLSDDDML